MFSVVLGSYAASAILYGVHLQSERSWALWTARVVLVAGAFVHGVDLVSGHLQMQGGWNITAFERYSLFSWLLVLAFFVVSLKRRIQVLGCFVPTVAFFIGLAGLASSEDPAVSSAVEPLKSPWFTLHLVTAVGGEALFAFSALLAIVYLWQDRTLKQRRSFRLLRRLPPLEATDRTVGKILKWGFLALTLGLLTGAIWAHTSFPARWQWDPKQSWATATWLAYALILHLRLQHRLVGRRGAWAAIFGSLMVLFTFVGTNLIYGSTHGFWGN